MINQNELIQEARKGMLYQMQDERLAQFKCLNETTIPNGIVFAGDSLTEFFPIHELLHTHYPMYNRGIRGFKTQRFKQELAHHVIDLKPSYLFLLIGINDVGLLDVFDIVERITQLIESIKKQLPDTIIYLESLYPVNDSQEYTLRVGKRNNQDIQEINSYLKTLDHIQFIDIYPELVDNTGNLHAQYTIDGIHLSIEGYRVVATIIQNILDEMK